MTIRSNDTSIKLQIVLSSDTTTLEKLERLASDIWTEHYSPIIGIDQVNYMLDKFQSKQTMIQQINDGYLYYILIEEENLIGYFSVLPKDDCLFLSKAYLVKPKRGKGLFSLMLNKIIHLAKENKRHVIELTVNKENTHSIDVYLSKGFKMVKEAVFDIGEGYVMDDYILQKHI